MRWLVSMLEEESGKASLTRLLAVLGFGAGIYFGLTGRTSAMTAILTFAGGLLGAGKIAGAIAAPKSVAKKAKKEEP